MTTDLDTRLRGAARSLHNAAGNLDPTTLPRDRRPLRAATLAVLVVVALTAVMVIARDDQEGSVATNPDGIPRLIPDAVPEGIPPLGGYDLPDDLSTMAESEPSLTLYGDPEAADPFAVADLAVSTRVVPPVPGEEEEGEVAADFELSHNQVWVRGVPGDVDDARGGPSLTWTEGETLMVTLTSHTLDIGQLVVAGDALALEGNGMVLASQPAEVTSPLIEVASMAGHTSLEIPLPTDAAGYVVGYETEDYSRHMVLTMFEGGDDELTLLRWFLNTDEQATLAGRDGWAGSDTVEVGSSTAPITAEMTSFVWEQAPGLVAAINGRGVSQADLAAAIDSLRPATDDEWSERREQIASRA